MKKYRLKVICPSCRQRKSAAWESASPLTATLYTHREQVELAPGEKPVRCEGSGKVVRQGVPLHELPIVPELPVHLRLLAQAVSA